MGSNVSGKSSRGSNTKKTYIEDEAEKSQMNAEIFLVEPKDQPVPHFKRLKASRLRDRAQIRKALAQRVRSALWIATTGPATALLFETLPHRPFGDDQRLLRLDVGHPNMQGLLRLHFKHIVSAQDGVTFLPTEELIEVLDSKNRADLLIGGTVIHLRSTVLLYRGNLESLEIPLSWFVARPGCVQPDSHDFSIGDYGQAIRLGQYEASTDAALYEFDEEYRVRAKKRLIAEDSSIGGAIRRLRLQKGLRQSDFPGVTAKEIARIEKGEVKKPHRLTLEKIAKRTGVSVEQLGTF